MNKLFFRARLIILFWTIISLQTVAAESTPKLQLDREIIELLALVETGQMDKALSLGSRLQEKYPGSRAVQLIFADLHNSMAFRRVSMDSRESYSRQMLEVLNELKARRKHAELSIPDDAIPDNIVMAGKKTRHIIAVDLSRSRLYLLEKADSASAFRLLENHYVSVGLGGNGKSDEGDLKTPIGIYRIDGFKNDEQLPELYGAGAFTLDFPNDMDRQLGISGSGIWLHGMPHDQLSRPPQTSEGCVVMRNELLVHLQGIIDRVTTPVILADSLNWSSLQNSHVLADSLVDHITRHPPPLQVAGNNDIDRQKTDPGVMFREFAGRQKLNGQDLEIFRYPAISQSDTHKTLYRVRFLQESEVEEDLTRLMQTQYWRHSPDGTWELMLENLETR